MSGLGSDLKLNCTSGVFTLTNCFFGFVFDTFPIFNWVGKAV